jgi:hypothetical protein
MPAERESPAAKAREATATALAGGIVVLTGALGVFGGLTGSAARLVRNYQWQAAVGIGCVLFAVVLALASRLLTRDDATIRGMPWVPMRGMHWSPTLLWMALVLFFVGTVSSVVYLDKSMGDDDRPNVTAQTTRDAAGNTTVSGTARATGLSNHDQIFVIVTGQTDKDTRRLYYSLVGANQDGVVEHAFSVILPSNVASVLITVGRVGDDSSESDVQTLCTAPGPTRSTTSSETASPPAISQQPEFAGCAFLPIAPTLTPTQQTS